MVHSSTSLIVTPFARSSVGDVGRLARAPPGAHRATESIVEHRPRSLAWFATASAHHSSRGTRSWHFHTALCPQPLISAHRPDSSTSPQQPTAARRQRACLRYDAVHAAIKRRNGQHRRKFFSVIFVRADAALGVALHRARRARPEPQPTMQLPSAASSRERCSRQQTSSQHIEPAGGVVFRGQLLGPRLATPPFVLADWYGIHFRGLLRGVSLARPKVRSQRNGR